jgi:hypothetical protein
MHWCRSLIIRRCGCWRVDTYWSARYRTSRSVAPLAAGNVPVWVAASFDGDIVLIPVDQVDEASELLRRAGHRVIG